MDYVVFFEDAADADPGVRTRLMPDHLAFLAGSGVDAAGPLTNVDGTQVGGLWIVSADDAETVDALVRADPFWPTGLRRSYRILAWRRVFADGRPTD